MKHEVYLCPLCLGTGVDPYPRAVPGKTTCPACRGRGYYLTAPEVRERNYEHLRKHIRKKALARLTCYQQFVEQHGTLVEFLLLQESQNVFARRLLERLARTGTLSSELLTAAERLYQKEGGS